MIILYKTRGLNLSKKESTSHISIGDLVEKINNSGLGRLAIVTDVSVENYYAFNAWIQIRYTDLEGGFEWAHHESLKRLAACDDKEKPR